jgi:hypothetical protein
VHSATPAIERLDARRHAQDLRECWQGRLLAHASGKIGAVALSILAHNYDDGLPILLRVVFPGFTSITAPFFCSAAKIVKTGHVCADMVNRDGRIIKNAVIFRDTRGMESELRRLADAVKLSDAERTEFFACAKRWVVADHRLDPTMDPADPEAKRLTVH